jgi:hypothetical protein
MRRGARSPCRFRPLAAVLLSASLAWLSAGSTAWAQANSNDEILERLRQLEREQQQMREQLKAKDAKLDQMQQELQQLKQERAAAEPQPTSVPFLAEGPPEPVATPQVAAVPATPSTAEQFFGRYMTAGRGFTLAHTELGEVVFSAYSYVRYLNQQGLDSFYVNGLGETVPIDKRNDVQLNKVKLEFKGWLIDPRFRYVLYTWTNNAAQGLGAQVVVGGNLRFAFNDALHFGGGIYPLPSVRSNEGMWPYFLGVDHRTLADEYFRGSYTMGFFAFGELARGLQYSAMLGNNLSILGVDAGQLDGKFATIAAALRWMPTTGEFGERGGAFGDYDDHQRVATRIGAHFTYSPEDAQEQPGTDAPDNSQIRLSNGTIIFTPGALAPGVDVENVRFYMTSMDAGVKYKGFALEGEYYLRWLNDFGATGPLPITQTFDHGYQIMASMMVWPRTAQVYTQASGVFGEFGDPWEVSAGINWWIFSRREVRLNLEYIYDRRSPVGYTAIPQVVGGTGSIFNGNLEMFF